MNKEHLAKFHAKLYDTFQINLVSGKKKIKIDYNEKLELNI